MFLDVSSIKILLDLVGDDSQDTLLLTLKEGVMRAVAQYIGVPYTMFPTADLDWVVDEITVARYSHLNSEGLKTESTDISRYDYKDDLFKQWLPFLDRWVDENRDLTNRRRLRML